jgi:hypothetical protein
MRKLILVGALLVTSSVHSVEFDDCFTWESKDLAADLTENYRVLPLSGRCQSLMYTDKLVIRARRLEMLNMAHLLHDKAKLDGHVSFYEKVLLSRDLMSVYGNRALLYIGAK